MDPALKCRVPSLSGSVRRPAPRYRPPARGICSTSRVSFGGADLCGGSGVPSAAAAGGGGCWRCQYQTCIRLYVVAREPVNCGYGSFPSTANQAETTENIGQCSSKKRLSWLARPSTRQASQWWLLDWLGPRSLPPPASFSAALRCTNSTAGC